MIIIGLFLVLSVIAEVNFISLPLTFLLLLFWAVTTQRNEVFALAFLAGLFLDLLTFHPLGISSAYLLILMLGIFLYRSKFEINTLGFFGIYGLLGSLGYMSIRGSHYILLGSIFAVLIALYAFKRFENSPKLEIA